MRSKRRWQRLGHQGPDHCIFSLLVHIPSALRLHYYSRRYRIHIKNTIEYYSAEQYSCGHSVPARLPGSFFCHLHFHTHEPDADQINIILIIVIIVIDVVIIYIWKDALFDKEDAMKHCQSQNGPMALSTFTHSTHKVQSSSFNKLWYLGQT